MQHHAVQYIPCTMALPTALSGKNGHVRIKLLPYTFVCCRNY